LVTHIFAPQDAALGALRAIHDNGVLHGDIRLANFLHMSASSQPTQTDYVGAPGGSGGDAGTNNINSSGGGNSCSSSSGSEDCMWDSSHSECCEVVIIDFGRSNPYEHTKAIEEMRMLRCLLGVE
jgi:serine/threonine protein kinase